MKHQFQSKNPFFQKTIPFTRGNEANKRYPCKLWKFLRVAVVSKAKNFKEMYDA